MHQRTMPQNDRRTQTGFSLVELAIVITIIGLVTGAILGGRALYEQAQISKLITQVEEIKTAHLRFKDKYAQAPGDFTNAQDFFPLCTDGAACNGNGDGFISFQAGESLRAWQHLTLAALYPGTYTGKIGSGLKLDSNIPAATLPRVGFDVNYHNDGTDFLPVYGRFGNSVQLGSEESFPAWGGPVFMPLEAYAIDKKFDDGEPATGSILVSTTESSSLLKCTTADETASTADYVLENKARTCRVWIFGID